MKNVLTKSVGALLILIMLLSTLAGCVNPEIDGGEQAGGENEAGENSGGENGEKDENTDENPDNNIGDENNGENNNAEHTHSYEWVTDVEPTYTAPGVKHKECECGDKTDENTIIQRALAEDVVSGGAIDPSLGSYMTFRTTAEFLDFFNESRSKINQSFLCFDATSDFEKGLINLDELMYRRIYLFDYEINGDEEFANPLIVISFGLYVEEFSQTENELPSNGASATLVFYMEFFGMEETGSEYEFIFHKYDNSESVMDYVIEVLLNEEHVGNIYYYQEIDSEKISREWIADYISGNLLIIDAKGEYQ